MNNRNLVICISAIVLALVVGSVVWPLSAQRDASTDRAIDSDFQAISELVDSYFSTKGRLPNELRDLKLTPELRSNAVKHSYLLDKSSARIYELCAVFKTDTTEDSSSVLQASPFTTPSLSSMDAQHKAGLDCVQKQVFGSGFDDFPLFPTDDSNFFESSRGADSDIQQL